MKELFAEEFQMHAVIAVASQDQPATQMAAGRVSHNSTSACPFGPPCSGATMATADKGCDTSGKVSVIPKHGAFIPGSSTVTWERLLNDWDLLQECAEHVPELSSILEKIRMVSTGHQEKASNL